MGSRPELQSPPEVFYNEAEATKYHSNRRMVDIQTEISDRCIELLALPEGKSAYILDVGCGSGLSGACLEEAGHVWLGLDISRDMLDVANERAESTGDVMQHDMGTGLPFLPATFEGCISVSALQWLCYSQEKEQVAKIRLQRFFGSLYSVLKRTARAALQFYPETPEQAVLISSCAAQAGFTGGVVIDYPNSSKAKKYYLVLSFDHGYKAPQALDSGAGTSVGVGARASAGKGGLKKAGGKHKQQRNAVKSREWVVAKKARQKKQGKEVRPNTKFTARKRKDKF